MESFKFKKVINEEKAATSSLAESMSIKGDHVYIKWLTEYEGRDL